MMMNDTYRHKGMRKKLASLLREKGIQDEGVLGAIEKIPRHFFFDPAFMEQAYLDKAFPIGEGQTISQPYTVAYQTALLDIKKGDKVLEIGTGSGYQASILAEMGASVFSIERQKTLFEKARQKVDALGYRIRTYHGDGLKGLPLHAPYQKILVTAGAIEVPDALREQLEVGGILVIPVGTRETQQMIRIVKRGPDAFEKVVLQTFRFVPLLADKMP